MPLCQFCAIVHVPNQSESVFVLQHRFFLIVPLDIITNDLVLCGMGKLDCNEIVSVIEL